MTVPPERPSNPFPESGEEPDYAANVPEDVFEGCLENFHFNHSGFDSKNWTEDCEPMDGYLLNVGLKVVDVVKQILEAGPELWYNVPRLRKLLVGTKNINNAVCLGPGGGFSQLEEQGDEEIFIWHLPRYFQDPAFEIEEEHILQNVLGEKVIQHPEATKLIDEHSFVFGIHIPWSSLANIFFTGRPHPQIFVGNSIEIGMSGVACAIADKYIRQVYLDHETTPGGDIIELRLQAELFVNSHSCTYLSEGVDEDADDQHFGKAFNHQLAMFIVIRERLERKYNKEIPMVFQDPRFRTPEEYFLQHIIGGKVVQHPECLQYMTEKSFVFAPYLTWEGVASTVLLRRPALYIGNNLENTGGTSIALAKTYVRQVYLTGNYEMGTDLRSLILQTNAFSEYYDKYEFDGTHDSIHKNNFKKHFENIWVHHPKEKNLPHPRQVSLGSSSAAPGPSELGPRNDSDDGSNETPPGPSAPIFTSI
ncbi:hypothetical protein VTO58DRAFT_106935 [Aureobasidium pullulans]|nr:hypothetical protein JADG_004102 [Aureobasidium pullulans]